MRIVLKLFAYFECVPSGIVTGQNASVLCMSSLKTAGMDFVMRQEPKLGDDLELYSINSLSSEPVDFCFGEDLSDPIEYHTQ